MSAQFGKQDHGESGSIQHAESGVFVAPNIVAYCTFMFAQGEGVTGLLR